MAFKDLGIGGCEFTCPVCNKLHHTTKEQENELGFWS